MKNAFIYKIIKTPCGRSKYEDLKNRSGFFAFIRLYWFVLIGGLKDWNLPNSDESSHSNS